MMTFRQKLTGMMAALYFKLSGGKRKQALQAAAQKGAGECNPVLLRAAQEGAVLLKNDGTLPAGRIALFGRGQIDTVYAGCGSGGDVVSLHKTNILQGLEKEGVVLSQQLKEVYRAYSKKHPAKQSSWGNWAFSLKEPSLKKTLVKKVAKQFDTAVVVLSRTAGEDRDCEAKEGSYYLSKGERKLLSAVREAFSKVAVVLNTGNLMDLSFLDEYNVNAALLVWQGGMEGGEACARLLCGRANPCGKLPATVAKNDCDYPSANCFGGLEFSEYREDIYVGYRYFTTFAPERMRYPFGFGLSYTTFSASFTGEMNERGGRVFARIRNTGARAGKEAVQLYLQKPNQRLNQPARELVAFQKTGELAAGGEAQIRLDFSARELSSYDEERSAFVLTAGKYTLYAGGDCLSAQEVCSFVLKEEIVLEQLKERCAPRATFSVLKGDGAYRPVRTAKTDLKEEMLKHLSALEEKKEGLAASLSPDELEALSRGDYTMDSPLGAKGNAGVMGGVLPSLREKGIPPVTMTDGPSGIRLTAAASLVPNATCLAASFDTELVQEVYSVIGREMKKLGSHVLLAPAMNLHRNPLCGRNFEYFSEDPYLSGKIASGAVRGLKSEHAAACVKHFACNNQEYNRTHNDSRLSERALRELYLRAFELCIKEAKPQYVMTSYNKINGVWAHYHFELVRGILRGEWGFEGCVITDWWMREGVCPQFKKLKDNAYRVRAGVNVLMPGGGYLGVRKSDGTLLQSLGEEDGISLAELQLNAEEILNTVCPQ